MNMNSQQAKSSVGLLLIVGDIVSNEQRDELCVDLQRAFQYIDNNKYHEIHDLFNNLIHENEFQADSQYRQIANTENGSIAGFLYLPSFHTLSNVLKDLFNICYHVCILYCGQQIDSNGALILSDSLFTCENFQQLFEENPSYLIQDLQIILPSISNQWINLSKNYLQKQLENIQINDLSKDLNQENFFGSLFYERLYEVFNNDSINFDLCTKLIPRDSLGTIAFDEPNLYILYGQQGEVSLFGIRGFVVLINGGFSQIPSYWNLIRGLQNIDACILTHFDYDSFPGLQTIIHRKTIPLSSNGQLCKPDIGAIFLNHTQRTKIQSTSANKSSSNKKLSINLTENIDDFLNNIKQLNIDTFDLIKKTTSKKVHVEPINLYKKVAFGSLDLYVLHPTASTSDDEKLLTTLQKIPIHNQQPTSSMIPHHHWYSSCLLLVWTPSSKSHKDSLVRILYTGACPQTLVFEALNRAQDLEFLHGFQPQQQRQERQQTNRINPTKMTTSVHTSAEVKRPLEKPKVSPSITNRVVPSKVQSKTPKASLSPTKPKPKPPAIKPVNSEKPRSTPTPKKTSPPITNSSVRAPKQDQKVEKSRQSASKPSAKPKQVKPAVQKPKPQVNQKQKVDIQKKHKEESITQIEHPRELEIQTEQPKEPIVQTEQLEEPEIQTERAEELSTENEDKQNSHTDFDEEKTSETHNDEHESFNDIEQNDDNDEQQQQQLEQTNEHDMSPDELNENNETLIENPDDIIERPDSVPLTNGHNQPFIESNTASPIENIQPQLSPHDPMTIGFIEGASDTENPFVEKTHDISDDEMEIIHHDISTSDKDHIPPTEEIDPQGLPVETNSHQATSTNKKSNNKPNEWHGNNTNHTSSSSKTKQTSSSSPIFYVDVAYIPYHGNEYYVDSEFFRRIRARYYILNAVQINHHTLRSLIDGKQQWHNQEHIPVTLVPTYDGEQLRQFFVSNKDRLAELNINILPAAARCHVQYDDESSPAQRLRFSSIYNTDE